MGKIRVKVLGDEEAEKKQQEEAQKRAEAKRTEAAKAEESTADETSDSSTEAGTEKLSETKSASGGKKQIKKEVRRTSVRSTKYKAKAELVDKNKSYKLADAVKLLPQLTIAKFDETVELHINTVESVSGNMTLPHGTGKQVRVSIINPTEDATAADDLVKKIEGGTIDFDVLIATPDAMPRLARVARVLGPRGLMPNPKNGTVTPKPEEAAKKFAGGQINYKSEAKFPILHLIVGKVSFGDDKLAENIKSAITSVKAKNIRSITLKSTMSPGMKLDLASL